MERNGWIYGIAWFGAGVVVAALVMASPAAQANDGQPVLAGLVNTETNATELMNSGPNNGLEVLGGTIAVFGATSSLGGIGVYGAGPAFGVEARSTADGGTGVEGASDNPTGIGVHGVTSGSGSGVFGEATGAGVAVNGSSSRGVGVRAQSGTGTALAVVGKATFSRSGVVRVPVGASSKTVTLAMVTPSSIVLATAQQATAVVVGSAVPAAGKFTIRLTGPAPAGGVKVAFFVLN